ncbi:MAG: hypothetical protein QS721_01990 [Candidatus Endonucleobacter sp. (ex Gigantidas childressi)]|nr:hypothetical protein [Candidatus Endonucleobacter sp. (ex Gigantidas childressi)]
MLGPRRNKSIRHTYNRRLSSCYVVGCVRSPQSPTSRRLTGFSYLLPSSNLKCFGYELETLTKKKCPNTTKLRQT